MSCLGNSKQFPLVVSHGLLLVNRREKNVYTFYPLSRMKTTSLPNSSPFLTTLFLSVCFLAQAQLPFRPLYEPPANAEEQQQLNSLFSQARAANASVVPRLDAVAYPNAVM